jgi:3-methyladenine DNA glycosylase/8-oxoguanine DNA glycosylase
MTVALDELSSRDPVVAGLVARHGRPQFPARAHGSARFESLARSIVFQQLAGNAATAIHRRLVEGLGGEVTPEAILACGPEGLRAFGLSGAKAAALTDLASKVADGKVSFARIGRLSDAEVVEHLVQVRGVGPWTAEMFLMFTLRRPDVWPTGDYGVRAGYAAAWGLAAMPSPRELEALGERFRPHRSLVAWYCWRAAEDRRSDGA